MYKLDHVVLAPYSQEVETWCQTTLGKEWHWRNNKQGLWNVLWSGKDQNYRWYFSEEKHAFWFLLKWSGTQVKGLE